MNEPFDLICVGGGAGGVFAAISTAELAQRALRISILEATARPMTKIKISGGGRCNVTHHCYDPKALIESYPRGRRFLLNSLYGFGPQQMVQWLEHHGVATKVESDGRIFPRSNNSQTIIDCFINQLDQHKIALQKRQMVKAVEFAANSFKLKTQDQEFVSKSIVMATGSAPIGHKLAAMMGHTITELAPSLFTLKSEDRLICDLAGLSVQSVAVELSCEKVKFTTRGPLLFTHWGFSGPAILKLSSLAARELKRCDYSGSLRIDFLPSWSFDDVSASLEKMKTSTPKKKLTNVNPTPLPQRLWMRIVSLAKLHEKTWADLSKKDISQITRDLKAGYHEFSGKGEFKDEFVTCGGVDLKEINPKTFESKLVRGLYFAGEIVDIDAVTGGFNFQNAWSNARAIATHLAGQHFES